MCMWVLLRVVCFKVEIITEGENEITQLRDNIRKETEEESKRKETEGREREKREERRERREKRESVVILVQVILHQNGPGRAWM